MTKSTLKKVILVGLVCGNILSCGQVWADAVDISIDSPTSVTPTDYGGGYDVDNGVWGISGSQTLGLNVINSVATVAGGVAHTVHGIRVVDGYVINVGSLFGGIAVKANGEDMGALGIGVGEGEISIENISSISATALDNGGCAFGIVNESFKNSVCSKSTITFVDEANIMVSACSSAYGILNSADKDGTSNTPYFVTSYSNIGNMNVLAVDSAYGYLFFSDNTNSSAKLTFAEGKIITVSSDGEAYGLYLEGLGTVDITKLGGIAAKAGGTEAAYGIYAANANDPAGSDVFSISFADAGGSISAYSATGENYGIKFDADSTGTSEVKNVKAITVGISGSNVSSGEAVGISSAGGTNNVVFCPNGSINVKADGDTATATGIEIKGGGTLTVSNLGGMTDGITIDGGTETVLNKIILSDGTLNLKNSTVKATNNAITVSCSKNSSMNLSDGTKVYGPVFVLSSKKLTVNMDSTSEWHVNDFKVMGAIEFSGKMFIEGKDLSVRTINRSGAANLVFDLTGISNGDTLLNVTTKLGVGTDSSDKFSAVNADKSNLKKGDIITLVDASATSFYSVDSTTLESVAGEYTITSDDTNKKIILTALKDFAGAGGGSGDKDTQKAPVEGIAAASAAVNSSSDLVTGAGMSNLITATATVNNTETFGAANFGNARYNSGSHVDAKGFGIMVGVGKKAFNKAGNKTTGGIFFEYGNSNFDTYNNNVSGEGKSIYKGGGYMMRFDNTCGNYYEGMIHAGKVRTNWSKHNSIKGESYDINPTYFGGALTYGHKFMVAKERQLAVYGSYIYTHTGGADAKIGDYNYNFDATNSHRTKVGVRYTASDLMDTSKFRPYVGLAWEHEYDAESRATVRGMGEAPAPSMKGDSGILELGFNQEVGKWTLGIGAEVFTGKRRGWSGTLQATYNF